MKKYLKDFINELEKLQNQKVSSQELENIKTKIQFFQHERLIHLLVTLFFAMFALICMALGLISYIFLIPFAILLVFIIFYIFHYFYLENGVQYLYKLYDQIFLYNQK